MLKRDYFCKISTLTTDPVQKMDNKLTSPGEIHDRFFQSCRQKISFLIERIVGKELIPMLDMDFVKEVRIQSDRCLFPQLPLDFFDDRGEEQPRIVVSQQEGESMSGNRREFFQLLKNLWMSFKDRFRPAEGDLFGNQVRVDLVPVNLEVIEKVTVKDQLHLPFFVIAGTIVLKEFNKFLIKEKILELVSPPIGQYTPTPDMKVAQNKFYFRWHGLPLKIEDLSGNTEPLK